MDAKQTVPFSKLTSICRTLAKLGKSLAKFCEKWRRSTPLEERRFYHNRTRPFCRTEAFAYCGTCDRWEPVNDKLSGYRFDCPLWMLDKIHVGAVIGTKWKHWRWVWPIVGLERYQAARGKWGKVALIAASVVTVADLTLPLPVALERFIAFLVGGLLLLDTVSFTSANALASQRPRFAPRSIFRAVLGVLELIIAFSLLHLGIRSGVRVNGNFAELDFPKAFYFSTVTLATVGYGVEPCVDPSRLTFWLVILQILVGLYYLSVFLATMVSWARGVQRPQTLSALLNESNRLDHLDWWEEAHAHTKANLEPWFFQPHNEETCPKCKFTPDATDSRE